MYALPVWLYNLGYTLILFIAGLTASPAGRETVEDTEKMLKRLLENIGDGKLAAIMENDRSFKELSKYKTQTKLIAKELGLTVNEKELQDELQKYLFLCYNRLSVETDFGNFDSREEVKTCQDLKGDVLEAFQIFLQDAKPIEPDRNIYIEALKLHCSVLCEALSAVGDGSVEFAFRVLQDLLNRSHPGSFEKAAELNLAHQKVKSLTEHFALRTKEEKEDDKMAVKTVAREILQGIDWDSREQGKQPFVLVLVKTRVVAQQMTEALKEMEELKERGICPVCIVGHGGGSSDGGGMTIKKQSRALEGIRNYEYQVVVATSVAEEGVDFPECELVIHMNPPSSVTALVQTRGRARKQGVSRFIALCREPGQKDKIELLQKKEENMYKAAKKIIDTY
ncbi:dicer-like protein 1 [Lingula anatina]|uniref:Dicer-like protein 1 n=1 Tax=Lingula anatina TaxID=7574 RepID=A0A1S3HEZ0_LINAN|nr:dicer-like protein 1 [Lingula anatina]|eukprot:XP_013384637.1 dicer-like protein 1 [Lingula anatina]